MPGRIEIEQEIAKTQNPDAVRRRYLADLAAYTGRDTIIYAAGWGAKMIPNLPATLVSIIPDDIQGFMAALQGLKGKQLDFILISQGGSLEAAEQIVNYLRSKYDHIRVIVPQNAMSAATMIACAGDVIVMGKQSAIGPIDPQITLPNGAIMFTSPAHAILADFDRAKKEVMDNPRAAPLWASKLQTLPHGILSMCQNVIDRSKERVADWLEKYMKLPKEKAVEVADWLGSVNEHKSHGRPICLQLAEEHGLKVDKLEVDQSLQDKVLSVFHATMVTLVATPCVKLIESHQGRGYYSQLQTMMPIAVPGMPGMPNPGFPVPGLPGQPMKRPDAPG
jgi:hypothetical protein